MELFKKMKALPDEDFEQHYGRHWIWASLDPASKVIINFFIGQRPLENFKAFIKELVERIRSKALFTSDELPPYETVLVEQFSHPETYPKTGKRGPPKKPRLLIDPDLLYATVHETRDHGKIVKLDRRIIVGDLIHIDHAIAASKLSNSINTSFIERVYVT